MKNYEHITKLYFRSIKNMEAIESTPKDFGTGDLLYSSEIHTLVAIAKHPGCNLTELAAYLDITKGGAGKFVKKLLNKNLIYKTQVPENRKEVIFGVTDKGVIAFESHEVFEQHRFGKIYRMMDEMKSEDVEILECFLSGLNDILESEGLVTELSKR